MYASTPVKLEYCAVDHGMSITLLQHGPALCVFIPGVDVYKPLVRCQDCPAPILVIISQKVPGASQNPCPRLFPTTFPGLFRPSLGISPLHGAVRLAFPLQTAKEKPCICINRSGLETPCTDEYVYLAGLEFKTASPTTHNKQQKRRMNTQSVRKSLGGAPPPPFKKYGLPSTLRFITMVQ